MSDRLVVLGAGGHAKVVIATALAAGVEVQAVYDDDGDLAGEEVLGVPVRVGLDNAPVGTPAVLALGANRTRARAARRLDLDWISLVHPSAVVHDSVVIEPGAVIFAGAVVQPGTIIGAHAIINTAASVDHDCRVGAYCHLAPGSHLAGGVTLGEGAFVGLCAGVINGVTLGAWSILGAGGVAVSDVDPESTVMGVPARPASR